MSKQPKSTYELFELLEEKYESRFHGDPLQAMGGYIDGRLDNQPICISYIPNRILMISSSSKSEELVKELVPLLCEVMGDNSPICSYNSQKIGFEEEIYTVEWDNIDPEKRLKDIVNHRALPKDMIMTNLKLYNSKDAASYMETPKEREEYIKNARIYGIDPGNLNVEVVNNYSEIELYTAIDGLGGHLWRCRHEMAHGRMPRIDLTEEQYALEYLVYQTKKFGVDLPDPEIGEHVPSTESYRAWFQHYDNHFKNELSQEEWNAFNQALKNGEDVSSFAPSGNWEDSLNKAKPKQANITQ